jgi:hypothetical protein
MIAILSRHFDCSHLSGQSGGELMWITKASTTLATVIVRGWPRLLRSFSKHPNALRPRRDLPRIAQRFIAGERVLKTGSVPLETVEGAVTGSGIAVVSNSKAA